MRTPLIPRSALRSVRSTGLVLPVLALGVLAACSSGPDLSGLVGDENGTIERDFYQGPGVHAGETGPARFVDVLDDAFRPKRAMDVVTYADQYYRAPASPGYDDVLDHMHGILEKAGFGSHEKLLLEVIERPAENPAWTPKSGRLVLHGAGSEPQVLHEFQDEEGVDRTMLPVHAPSCSVEGQVALDMADLKPGMIFVTDVTMSRVLSRARRRGAAAVLSASLGSYNVDPSGKDRHLDAVQFKSAPADNKLPVAQISPRSFQIIRSAVERAQLSGSEVRLALEAETVSEERPLRTLVATVLGETHPKHVVAISSHIQEPGACDNGTGIAGLVESARSLAGLLKSGELEWPRRGIVFIWGDEFRQSEHWLDHTDLTPVAGISSDMTGQSRETGAIALLERMPDPGALVTLPPDVHSAWGAGEVDPDSLQPNGFAVIARCAMLDVGIRERDGWPASDHPWEGGSDHDVYIDRGVPACLFWHFTDFTYHTSLDRLEYVDREEIRRTGVALLATALAVADARPGDLDRYLHSLDIEEATRVAAAIEAGDELTEARWREWCLGAREWLRNLCLDIDEDLPR